MATVLLMEGCEPADDSILEEVSDRHYPVDSVSPTISVSNRDGSVSIYGAGGDLREIRVEVLKKAFTPERLKAISVTVNAQPNSISIETDIPENRKLFSDRSGTVDLVIVVPQAATISKLELHNGEVLLEEVRSPEGHARLGTGRLFVHNCFGSFDIQVQTGNVGLIYDWWEQRDFSIRSRIEDGNAFAFLPDEAAFHLIANSVSGKVANDFEEKEQRQPEGTNHADVLVGGLEKPKIEIETNDGNIRIAEHNP
ncbi:MAG TPA: DUF4097 family beta strand repeat-containing protein [Chthoniobacterales bacterium]|nr:DUF4097 family beta strand repeat-containing protein [Chthoniobacterales bacterium]